MSLHKVPTVKYSECILGNTPCGIKVVQLYNEGILPPSHWTKMAKTYNFYAWQAREVWESPISYKTKRHLDNLLFQDVLRNIDALSIHLNMQTHLKNIIRAHHRKLAKAYSFGRVQRKRK